MAAALRRRQAKLTDTIFAVSSGRPPAAIAVIRVSGSDAFRAVAALAGKLPAPRRATLRTLACDGVVLDRALVLCFPGPGSATGEDLAELHCHGGRAVIAAVEAALADLGLRRAEAGEFTRRALQHGRIDLMEAEGLADLLEAETETQRVSAMAAAEGRLSARTRDWLDRIAILSARIEAQLDHSDEDDVGDELREIEAVACGMLELRREIEDVLQAPSVERLRDGVRVVIAGPPNSGKSTLLNLLAERDVAIVSPIAGTTRDRIEAAVVRAGMPLLLVDTAGLTQTNDVVEKIGVDRAYDAIHSADLLVWLGDEPPLRTDAVWVHARNDLPGRAELPAGRHLAISSLDPGSIRKLADLLATHASVSLSGWGDMPAMREHQRQTCSAAAAMLEPASDPILIADALAATRRRLASLLGYDATDAMLDALFSRFCIGK